MPKPSPESRLKTVTWRNLVDPYMTPDNKRSIWQIVNTIIPLVATYCLMYLSLSYSFWLTLALALPAGGFMLRTLSLIHI